MTIEEKIFVDKVERFIDEALKSYVNKKEEKSLSDMHSRVDELFLLFGKITHFNFVRTCEYFGINYDDFSDRNYNAVKKQVKKRFKKYFEELGEYP
jgi:hypothetical protein